MTTGIYRIRNTLTGDVYVGKSSNVQRRWMEHQRALIAGTHSNDSLQRAWWKHGAHAFHFGVIQELRDNAELSKSEQYWIDYFVTSLGRNRVYNRHLTVAPGAGAFSHVTSKSSLQVTSSADKPASIEPYLARGYIVKRRQGDTIHLIKPKRFNKAAAWCWLTLGFGVGLLVYLAWYAVRSEDRVSLQLHPMPIIHSTTELPIPHAEWNELVEQPGYVRGRHFSSFVDEVKRLKREQRHDEAIVLLHQLVKATEKEDAANGGRVAPWYYEQLAIIHRKEGNISAEIAILERYERHRKAMGAGSAVLAARLVRARDISRQDARRAHSGHRTIVPVASVINMDEE